MRWGGPVGVAIDKRGALLVLTTLATRFGE